ncbi:cephalosporin hydroxylase [filamentous cyanobacterium Phorm 6]|jgi:cephalosporin hydroxylase|nr:cephalosporin hydroxylase [filamentous cyanobacterium Phorm 6]
MSEVAKFFAEVTGNIDRLKADVDVQALSRIWLREITSYKYPYNFTWMGRPIIQLPQDVMAMQEIIWKVKPDLIIETGIAHGGSLIFHSSMLELIGGEGQVLGIDVDIRQHNRVEIEKHPMFKRITMIEGSSIDEEIAKQVFDFAKGNSRVLVILDSNHTHDHVLKELELYSPLVTKDSYLVVFDTVVEDMPEDFFSDRPWGKGNNPKTAVWEFLKTNKRFEIDKDIEAKLLITVAPDGYLKCVED